MAGIIDNIPVVNEVIEVGVIAGQPRLIWLSIFFAHSVSLQSIVLVATEIAFS